MPKLKTVTAGLELAEKELTAKKIKEIAENYIATFDSKMLNGYTDGSRLILLGLYLYGIDTWAAQRFKIGGSYTGITPRNVLNPYSVLRGQGDLHISWRGKVYTIRNE